MIKLNANWLTDGLIDFEYKKYQLLAYLKGIRKEFRSTHLYPSLADLITHHSNLSKVKDEKDLIYDQFPDLMTGADFEKLKITYSKKSEDDELIKELVAIISYALPKFKGAIEEGKEIYEFVESNMAFEPVGIIPMYNDEGFLLINKDRQRDISVYRYQMSVFESPDEKYRGLKVDFVSKEFIDLGRTLEKLKVELATYDKNLPNPATYLVTYKLGFPELPTVLPVAKRMLIRHLSAA